MERPRVAKSARALRYNWDDILYFLEVARTRNLVRAGQKLKVDHTTVSRRIRELERSLNTTLFKRSKAGFSLTEAGLRLLQFAEGMENNANAIIETVVGSEKADAFGAVRIASMEGIGSMYLTNCMADFNKVYPSIQAELITDTRLLDMTRREADIFVSFFRPKGRRLSVKKIGEFKIFSIRLERVSCSSIRSPPISRISTTMDSSISSTSTSTSRKIAGFPIFSAEPMWCSRAPAWYRNLSPSPAGWG